MMSINIDQLTEAQLLDLNYRIVERLKMLSQMKAHAQMLVFRIGQRVTFRSPDGVDQVGVIAKYNRKSVTVVTDVGQQWNVAPGLLKAVSNMGSNASAATGEPVFSLASKGG